MTATGRVFLKALDIANRQHLQAAAHSLQVDGGNGEFDTRHRTDSDIFRPRMHIPIG